MLEIDPQSFMAQALALAEKSLWLTSPNPRVGCVITDAQGRILGQGHTQKAGGAHAEIMALRHAESHGNSVVGATVYVTLEPAPTLVEPAPAVTRWWPPVSKK
jgi:diaminohydroxyphosphoribosylaminopyrimidine deaminase/5-amino-6-(5-phosphoribosylamino)uracil reductase